MTAPPSARPTRSRARVAGGSLAAALVLGCAAAALAAPVLAGALPAAFLAGCCGASWWAGRRRALDGVVLCLWLWVLAPGLRRVVDLQAGYTENSLVLLAPPAASVLLGVVRRRDLVRLRPPLRGAAAMLAGVLALGAVTGVVGGASAVAVISALLQYGAPLALGAVAAATPRAELAAAATRFAAAGAVVVGGYGLVQFLVLPAWDAQWLLSVDDQVSSFGLPEPLAVRVFSLLSSPVAAATFLLWAALWLLGQPSSLARAAPLLLAVTGLGLTSVRACWLCLGLGLLVLALRGQVGRRAVVALAVGAVLALALPNPVTTLVTERVTTSVTSGGDDVSLRERTAFQVEQFPRALASVTGQGLGSTGTAARRGGGGAVFTDVDSGYLTLLLNLGSLPSLALLLAVVPLRRLLRRGGSPAPGGASYALTMPVYLVLADPLAGSSGAVLWLSLAVLGAEPEPVTAGAGGGAAA